jgi:predicted alpha/beta hydrolase family esterase
MAVGGGGMGYKPSMRVSDLDLIFIPETGPVSPEHWIARWSAKLSTARLVAALDPVATASGVIAAAQLAQRPTLLIGHSTGAIAAALAADALGEADVRGAFLVAPPADDALATLDGGLWPEIPRARLPWPSVLVASRTDPLSSHRQSLALASDWGADFTDAGDSGRIDADSGHGPWPDGLLKLGAFLKKLG